MRQLLLTFSWQELRHHPWRHAAAVLAVMLGVALAFSVHLINASALDEFSHAARAVGGQPDLTLRAVQGDVDETLYVRVARQPQVAQASPVLDINTQVLTQDGQRWPLRVLGIDALQVASIAPDLLPQTQAASDRLSLFAPATVFLNPAAQQLGLGPRFAIQSGLRLPQVTVAGTVAATGPPLAVMDVAAAQELFGRLGQLTRVDLRLQAGTDRAAWARTLQNDPNWPPQLLLVEPGEATQRIAQLSRAYRVNLTVLALVALFTGAFLVYSVLALGVAKRAQQFALLGVLGLTGRERLTLVWCESLVLGLVGSVAGLALGSALAALALHLLGGDLGGGFFAGVAPSLQWHGPAALAYGSLGVAAALAGGWWPARQAQRLPPAPTLKGLGITADRHAHGWIALLLIAIGLLLTRAPVVFDIPLAAYLSIALLLVGGITGLPALIGWLLQRLRPYAARHLLPLLALERARRQRNSAAMTISGVVAALSLAVALTVMVTSFRGSVMQWLDQVLPADLYVRSASTLSAADSQYFTPALVQAAAQLPGVLRVEAQRQKPLLLATNRPAVALIARTLGDPARTLPLQGDALPVPSGQIGIYVSEAMLDLHGAQVGHGFAPLAQAFKALNPEKEGASATFFVAGVWRDYARQSGAIAIDRRDYEALSGDTHSNDLALWLAPGVDPSAVQSALRDYAEQDQPGSGALLEFGSASQIRATSLRIFDRSFAVTYWLQAVAIGIGLFGIAASFSAQVLARRKEFGLLAHLGFTRAQILGVVAGEGAAWTATGALAGLGLGLAVAVVLVHVVNPQSFHWRMELLLPWSRLLMLCGAVVLAGTLTAWLAGRAAAGRDAVLAVKEDW